MEGRGRECNVEARKCTGQTEILLFGVKRVEPQEKQYKGKQADSKQRRGQDID